MTTEAISTPSSKKRKKAAVVMSAVAGVALLIGSLAYFTDRETANTYATAGTVDVGITANWQSIENFNPGDVSDLSYTVSSLGNKSVDVRETLVVKSSVAMSEDAQAEFEIYDADDVSRDSNGAYIPNADAVPVATDDNRVLSADKTSITYSIDEYVLNGTGSNAETESGVSATSKESNYVLVFKHGAKNAFQGAEVTVDLMAEAKQHRNTGSETWETVATDSITVGGETVNVVPAK